MRTIIDPPSDPLYNAHECQECDQPMGKGLDGQWMCDNPDCKNSPYFMPFLKIPEKTEFRFVNEGERDVSIRFYQDGASYEDLTFLRMVKFYGWFIDGEDDEEGTSWELPDDAPHIFKTLDEAIDDARKFIEQFPESDVLHKALGLLQDFKEANKE